MQTLFALPPDDIRRLYPGVLDMRRNHSEVVGIQRNQFEVGRHGISSRFRRFRPVNR